MSTVLPKKMSIDTNLVKKKVRVAKNSKPTNIFEVETNLVPNFHEENHSSFDASASILNLL